MDKDQRITVWNPGMEALMGYKAEEVIGKNPFELFPFLEQSGEHKYVLSAFEGVPVMSLDGRYESAKSRRQGHFEASYSPITDQRGEITGVLGIIRERTAWKRSQALLAESEQRFRTLSNAAFEGIGVSEDGIIIEANDRLAEMMGYPREELIGKRVMDMVAPESQAMVLERWWSGSQGPYEHLAVSKDGSVFPVEIHARVVPMDGRTVRIAAIRDVTARRETEEKISKANQRLHALASRIQAVREEERAAIARELHDELGQAMTSLRMDLTMYCDELPETETEARGEVEAMIELVDQSIGRIQSLSAGLRPPILDLFGLGAAIEWLVEEVGSRTDLEFELDLARGPGRDVDQEVSTAVFRIAQEALTNVLRHADARRVGVTLVEAHGQLSLEVEDDGIGIPPDATTDIRSLGLLGMIERAEAFGGSLEITPRESGSTIVSLRIPQRSARPKLEAVG